MMNWLDIAFNTVATAAALVGIFEGVRRVSISSKDKLGLGLVVCGVFWCVCGAAWLTVGASNMQTLLEEMRKTPSKELPKDWGNDLSPNARATDSLSYASSAYISSGALLQHFDHNGMLKIFLPSQQQLRERESFVSNVARLESQSENSRDLAFRLGISALIVALLGWMAGRYGTANRSFEKDA